MTIEFKTPNGVMKIYADTFFDQQTITKIRKMLKCYRDSYPEVDKIKELKNWLLNRYLEEKQKAAIDLGSKKAIRLAEKYKTILDDVNKIVD